MCGGRDLSPPVDAMPVNPTMDAAFAPTRTCLHQARAVPSARIRYSTAPRTALWNSAAQEVWRSLERWRGAGTGGGRLTSRTASALDCLLQAAEHSCQGSCGMLGASGM